MTGAPYSIGRFEKSSQSVRGQVIELDRQHMMALIQTDAELGEILTRAFILRRVESTLANVPLMKVLLRSHPFLQAYPSQSCCRQKILQLWQVVAPGGFPVVD